MPWVGPSGPLVFSRCVMVTTRTPPPRWAVHRWGPRVVKMWERANKVEEKLLMAKYKSRVMPSAGMSNTRQKEKVSLLDARLEKLLRRASCTVARIEEDMERMGRPAFVRRLRPLLLQSAMIVADREAMEEAQAVAEAARRPIYVASSDEEEQVVSAILAAAIT